MQLKKVFLYISLSFLLSACSSQQPTSFYLLKTIDSNIAASDFHTKSITVLVNPIKFPEYLDRPQMITRDSHYKLQLSEKHRWAEPLKNEFTRVFIANLNNRIFPSHALIYSELNGVQPEIQLSIEVLQLDINTDNQAVLSVKWVSKVGNNIKRFTKKFSIPIKDKSYESRIEAQSRAIAIFTDYVVEKVGIN